MATGVVWIIVIGAALAVGVVCVLAGGCVSTRHPLISSIYNLDRFISNQMSGIETVARPEGSQLAHVPAASKRQHYMAHQSSVKESNQANTSNTDRGTVHRRPPSCDSHLEDCAAWQHNVYHNVWSSTDDDIISVGNISSTIMYGQAQMTTPYR